MNRQQLPFFRCTHCDEFIPIKDARIAQLYFVTSDMPCPFCKRPLDLWDVLLKEIREVWPLNVFALVGAQGVVTTIRLHRISHCSKGSAKATPCLSLWLF